MAAVDIQIPSSERVEPGSTNLTPESLPKGFQPPASPAEAASATVDAFNEAISKKDYSSVASLFAEGGYWRDHLCLSWDLRTAKGRDKIKTILNETSCPITSIAVDTSSPFRSPQVVPLSVTGDVQCLQFFINVTTELGSGQGVVRMSGDQGTWGIYTFFTTLRELSGHESATGTRRSVGVDHGSALKAENWKDQRNKEFNMEERDPTVLILGAGQGGLAAAARLKALGVDTLIVDKVDRVGDSWRNRYHQLVLHDPVWYDHMPYLSFPSTWPIFTPKDKLADFFESYVSLLELNVWTKTTLTSSKWSDAEKRWTVTVDRVKSDGTTETRTLHPRHVVQATGHSGKKNMPTFEGMADFKGDLLCHSSEFPGVKANGNGKRAIIVGSCNSGHDIAQDYYNKGYSVTMIQRSSTLVISSGAITKIGMRGLYDENGPPTEDADLFIHSVPSELFKTHQIGLTKMQNAHDAKTLQGLEKAGFKLDMGPSCAGLLMKYFHRGGGYYIDVGASQLIVDGHIKIKHGIEITKVLPNGILFADGETLEADEIVFATGYQNMRSEARSLFGDEVADKVGDIWGFNEEGELRTLWRRTAHPGFWFMAGNLALCRYYSRILALSIKSVDEGLQK